NLVHGGSLTWSIDVTEFVDVQDCPAEIDQSQMFGSFTPLFVVPGVNLRVFSEQGEGQGALVGVGSAAQGQPQRTLDAPGRISAGFPGHAVGKSTGGADR